MTSPPSVGIVRGPGRPARISRQQIIEAAVSLSRDVGLDELRMSAVAARLGVRPSALNYYITDRDELVELAAAAQLDWPPLEEWLPEHVPDWREWARAIAHHARASFLAKPDLAVHIRSTRGRSHAGLDVADQFLGALSAAGLDPVTMARASTFLMQVIFSSVQAELEARRPGAPNQRGELEQAVAMAPDDELEHVRSYLDAGGYADWEGQFSFNLDRAIAAIEDLLDRAREDR